MVRTRRVIGVLVAAMGVVIGGCGGGGDAPVGSLATVPTSAPETQAAAATPAYSGERIEAVLIEWKWNEGQLIPLDSALRTARAPASLQRPSALAFASPDGSLVAVSDTAGLAVYRVDQWERLLKVEEIRGPARVMWTGDGGMMYLVNNNRLFEVTVATGALRDVGGLGNPLIDAAVSPDGAAVFALSYEGDANLIDVRNAHFAVIDTTTGEVKRRAELGNVVVGQQSEQGPTEKYLAVYWPALALSPDGRRAYIAHSDFEAVTVVDLDLMAVEQTAALQAPRSRWERFTSAVGNLFVSRAEAKGGLYFRRESTVSPDGRWLYVTGSVPKPCGFFACEDDAPAGLWVVDTHSMRVVHREEGINHIVVSSDGAYVAGTGTSYSQEKGMIGRGVKVLRTGTWERVLHFEPEAALQSPAFTPDATGLLVVLPGKGLEYAGSHRGECKGACYSLRRVDLKDGRVNAARDLYGHTVLVTAIPGRKR
jgi:sugar lactone lactonase YvrE